MPAGALQLIVWLALVIDGAVHECESVVGGIKVPWAAEMG